MTDHGDHWADRVARLTRERDAAREEADRYLRLLTLELQRNYDLRRLVEEQQ